MNFRTFCFAITFLATAMVAIATPTKARFLQTDPVGYGDNMNMYAYVNNDPVNATDPSGAEGLFTDFTDLFTGRFTQSRERMFQDATRGPTDVPSNSTEEFAMATMAVLGAQAVDSFIDTLVMEVGGAALGQTLAVLRAGRAATGSSRVSTLRPGPHATESVPATGPRTNASQKRAVTEIGNRDGCHTCGTRDPGTQSGNFIPDHQPPTAMSPQGGSQVLHPQCSVCSNRQGGEVSGAVRRQRGRSEPATGTRITRNIEHEK